MPARRNPERVLERIFKVANAHPFIESRSQSRVGASKALEQSIMHRTQHTNIANKVVSLMPAL